MHTALLGAGLAQSKASKQAAIFIAVDIIILITWK